jgi:hypothetical protein
MRLEDLIQKHAVALLSGMFLEWQGDQIPESAFRQRVLARKGDFPSSELTVHNPVVWHLQQARRRLFYLSFWVRSKSSRLLVTAEIRPIELRDFRRLWILWSVGFFS